MINLRVLDHNGTGSDSAVIAAIQRAIQLKSQYNIRVINLSIGRPVTSSYTVDPLCIAVVVAAGNKGRNNSAGTNGYATITAPGNDPYVITVGAMNTNSTLTRFDDKITSYSSKGPTLIDHIVKPDLVAPGNKIFSLRDIGSSLDSTYPSNQVPAALCLSKLARDNTSEYFQLSGTSMAAPMVSGAIALMLEKDSTLTPDQTKARLMLTAQKLPEAATTSVDSITGVGYVSQNDIFTIGAGYLDIQATLASTAVSNRPALSPTASFDPQSGNVYLVSASSAIWGSSVIWGSSAIWGSASISSSSSALTLNGDK